MSAQSDAIIDKLGPHLDLDHRSVPRPHRGAVEAPHRVPGWTVQDNLSHLIGTELMLQVSGHHASGARLAIRPQRDRRLQRARGRCPPRPAARRCSTSSRR